MAIVEEVPDAGPSRSASSANHEFTSATDLQSTLRALSARLALPEDVLPQFISGDTDESRLREYVDGALRVVRQIRDEIDESQSREGWEKLDVQGQVESLGMVLRLYQLNEEIDSVIRSMPVKADDIALHILSSIVRPYFAPHPSLSTATRALSRPAGGPDALGDMHDAQYQTWKSPDAWGVDRLLSWCGTNLSSESLTSHIGLILPPTLTMIDDWEPLWRSRGIDVLDTWVKKVDREDMRRMGLDKLLVKSSIHTLSMHGEREARLGLGKGQGKTMRVTLELVYRMTEAQGRGRERGELVQEIMDKGIIQGWIYAPSGKEGRQAGIKIARDLEVFTGFVKEGVLRWLKMIVPYLLQPLQFPPTPAAASHMAANLQALLTVLRAVASTGRAPRWRGQILDTLANLWLMLVEREREDEAVRATAEVAAWISELKDCVRGVVGEMEKQFPKVRTGELQQLLDIDHTIFEKLLVA